MHLTCIGAAERPHKEVRAVAHRSHWCDARDGMSIFRLNGDNCFNCLINH